MWVIAGLGNPGSKYATSRHNIGFMVLDRLAERWSVSTRSKKFSSQFGQGQVGDTRALLAKPQTYMNCSGDALQPMAAYHKVPPSRVLVIHDELDLPFGTVRVKLGGGHAGHNGLRSIGARLGGSEYPRIRVGIARPSSGGDVTGYVLGSFSSAERPELDAVIDRSCDAIERVLGEGVVAAMNAINGLQSIAP